MKMKDKAIDRANRLVQFSAYQEESTNTVGYELTLTDQAGTTDREDLINLLTSLALQDDWFYDVLMDTFDRVLVGEVEIDDLMNDKSFD